MFSIFSRYRWENRDPQGGFSATSTHAHIQQNSLFALSSLGTILLCQSNTTNTQHQRHNADRFWSETKVNVILLEFILLL